MFRARRGLTVKHSSIENLLAISDSKKMDTSLASEISFGKEISSTGTNSFIQDLKRMGVKNGNSYENSPNATISTTKGQSMAKTSTSLEDTLDQLFREASQKRKPILDKEEMKSNSISDKKILSIPDKIPPDLVREDDSPSASRPATISTRLTKLDGESGDTGETSEIMGLQCILASELIIEN
jgi:hypothetical protein